MQEIARKDKNTNILTVLHRQSSTSGGDHDPKHDHHLKWHQPQLCCQRSSQEAVWDESQWQPTCQAEIYI